MHSDISLLIPSHGYDASELMEKAKSEKEEVERLLREEKARNDQLTQAQQGNIVQQVRKHSPSIYLL